MNTISIVVAVGILWLVMGLGFLTFYTDARRQGTPPLKTLLSVEGILLTLSVALPLLFALYRLAT